jgi:hypothetical protein
LPNLNYCAIPDGEQRLEGVRVAHQPHASAHRMSARPDSLV